jgi:hypothetical protein
MNAKVTDNVELDFPARMNDARMFTDYRQNCILNNGLTPGLGSFEMKDYLMNNATTLMDSFRTAQEKVTACTTCTDNTVLPVKTVINCGPQGCTYKMNDPSGVGQGREFNY